MHGTIIATAGATPTASLSDTDSGGGGGSTEQVETFSGAVDTAVTEVQDLVAGLVAAIPRLLIGLVVLAVFWGISRLVRRILEPRLVDLQGESIARVFTGLVGGFIIGLGAFVFATIVFPSVNLATMLGAGGVLALAAGFAFQDIAENLLAGLLLLIRKPFEEGDVVDVDGALGTVEAITVRETRIRRFDKQVMVVPNSQVYSNAIRIQTNREGIRSNLVVGVGYGDDLQLAEDVAIEAMRSVEGVLDDPAPEAFYVEFGGSSINLDLRYFHDSGQHELRRVQGEIVKAVKAAFDENGIDIPFPIVTLDAMDDVQTAVQAIGERQSGDGGETASAASSAAAGSDRSS